MGFSSAAKKYKEVSKLEIMPEEFILDVGLEEFEKSGSKFAKAGLHLVELGLPEWENQGVSIRFPFIIIEDGEDSSKEGKLVAGVGKNAAWKLKEILKSAEVPYSATKDGRVAFKSNDVVGKQCKVLYTEQVDTRTPEEGGKGTRYTKAESAYPVSATSESLGI